MLLRLLLCPTNRFRYNQGQVCTATSRVLVQEGIYEKFVEAFKKHVKTASIVGDPFKDDTFQGPQVTKAQFDRVLSYVETGKSEGATLVAGGEAYKNVGGKGFFVAPTIFKDVTDSMRIYREEVFGPFVVISSFKEEEEAIRRANDTTYGLGAAVFTENITKAHRVARRIEAGMVWINSSNDSDIRVPFGGVKQSGIGRELGEAGLEAYTNKKVRRRCRGRRHVPANMAARLSMLIWVRSFEGLKGAAMVGRYSQARIAVTRASKSSALGATAWTVDLWPGLEYLEGWCHEYKCRCEGKLLFRFVKKRLV
jgi:delta 1-pyrroline-5-carboxylate dehydrogenase